MYMYIYIVLTGTKLNAHCNTTYNVHQRYRMHARVSDLDNSDFTLSLSLF